MKIKISPISTNKMFYGVHKRTKDHREWEDEFLWKTKRLCKKTIKDPVCLIIDFRIKNDKKTDIDNLLKASLDGLVKAGFIKDDRLIHTLLVFKSKTKTKEDESIEFYFAKSLIDYIYFNTHL